MKSYWKILIVIIIGIMLFFFSFLILSMTSIFYMFNSDYTDADIGRKLPPTVEEQEPGDLQGNARNIYEVYINTQDILIVEDNIMRMEDLREGVKQFINNHGKNPELSDSPEKAIISLVNSHGTSYETYIAVQNELTAAYNELRYTAAMKKYGMSYKELDKERKKIIRKMYPMKISEAPPREF